MPWPPFLTPKSNSLEDFLPFALRHLFAALLAIAVLILAFRIALHPHLPTLSPPLGGVVGAGAWVLRARRGP